MLATAFDLLGLACLAALAWFIWPPLVLGVVGVALIVAGWTRS